MNKKYEFKLEYKQETAYKIIDDLYEWLLKTAKNIYNQLKDKCYDDFNEYYNEIIKDLLQKKQILKTNKILNSFNIDSINRLNIIVQITKKEYNTITDLPNENKDCIYFNSLLGWYESIIYETDLFIESLYNKQ